MISKSQLNKIIFIKKYIVEKDLFINELFKKLELYSQKKLSKEKLNDWLDSWEATAELDQDPKASQRIKKALKEIKSGKTPYKSWKEFKQSIDLS